MIAKAVQQLFVSPHMRSFDPYRDFSDLANLMEVAFSEELDLTRSSIVQDMRQLALYGPLIALARFAVPSFAGFVWVEDGRVVGNASMNVENAALGIWKVSNVAVLPEFRGRGIAGQLLDTAIEFLSQRGATRIVLQVRAGNEAALALYRRRGFVHYGALHEMELAAHAWPAFIGFDPMPLRRVRRADGPRLFPLVVASTPSEAWRARPLRPEAFRRGLVWHLQQFVRAVVGDPQDIEIVGEAQAELVAYGRLTLRPSRGPHEVQLHVLPRQRGLWESALVESLLRSASMSLQSVRAYAAESHTEAVEALRKFGFVTLRVLDEMCLWLTH